MTIRDQRFIYHLTSFDNISSILRDGLQPRAALAHGVFRDVADADIIEGRTRNSLENFVPFHWFARNPFDGRVQRDRPDEDFVLIAVNRGHASQNNWRIIPSHPLAGGRFELMSYVEGFAAIDWDLMDRRDYANADCRHVCMSECLSPAAVPVSDFAKIYVPTEEIWQMVSRRAQDMGYPRLWVDAAPNMFSNR
ncbi:DarT ssDNA thymidine ADP-ribosyltransferase family protein [Pseudomonas sp. Pseu.R1]|uniref:DarT ssDNA thymidine ADP-ribosyltransferase family protein n=1 Tax=Pseudomonas sp. Pseu.R1 TaxID=3379818 RepID=UPI003B947E53